MRQFRGGGKETVTWHQCPTLVREYLANVTYDPTDYGTSQIANYAPTPAVSSNRKPIGKTIDGVTYYNEIPNKDTPFSSTNTAGTVKPLDRLRWLNTITRNVRDLGGWACDGGTVKYGKLLRGGEPKVADKDLMVNQVGVKHELNLRGQDGGIRDYSVWGIGYTQFDEYVGYALSNLDLWKKQIGIVFDCVIHDKSLYFHCTAGGDRTGSLAVIIEALLGMAQSDIDKDYELSCFDGNGEAQYTPRNRTEYVSFINTINALNGSTFRDKVVNWVASLGFTANEINAFRSAMIEGTPEVLSPTITNYTITNTLSNVVSDNAETTIAQGQQYKAKLTPAENKSIDTFSVTMGGASVGANAKTIISGGVVKSANNHYVDINIGRVMGNIVITATGVFQGLPTEYQQVEYIGTADTNSYIDTGLVFDLKAKVQWKEECARSGSYMWGAAEDNGRQRFMHTVTSTASQIFGSNSSSYLTLALSYTDYPHQTVEYECNSKIGTNSIIFDDITNNRSNSTTTQTMYTMSSHIYLLAQNYNGSARSKADMKLYYFKWYNKDGNLAGDFVPCYRKADNVIGLYDLITGTFKTNGGTGTLTKGIDVN